VMIWLDAHLTRYPIMLYLSGYPVREYFQCGCGTGLANVVIGHGGSDEQIFGAKQQVRYGEQSDQQA
jgi:hypothetical protein